MGVIADDWAEFLGSIGQELSVESQIALAPYQAAAYLWVVDRERELEGGQ